VTFHRVRVFATATATVAAVSIALAADPAPAWAGFNPLKPLCGVLGDVNGLAGKACGLVQHPGTVIKAGGKLLSGNVGGAVSTLAGGGGGSSSSGSGASASTALGLAAIGVWVIGGARFALHETSKLIAETTSPQLGTTWFSSAYWRIAGIAAVLTLPFLFAAAVQSLLRSDLTLLARAALGYLPLAFLAVSIAAPIAMLLLAASDQLSAVVSSAGARGGAHFLAFTGAAVGILSLLHHSAFLAFLVGLFTVAGAVVLWLELLARDAAVYVVVLMMPLAFAALCWPARRTWAIRAVELLVALILSKFAMVAVLALGGAALAHVPGGDVTSILAGLTLLILGAFAPWALVRLLPLAELASGAAASLRGEGRAALPHLATADAVAAEGGGWAATLAARMRRQMEDAGDASGGSMSAADAAAAENERIANDADRLPDEPADETAAQVGAIDPAADGAADEALHERIPGMGRMWQVSNWPAENGGNAWRPLDLGPFDPDDPPRVWPPDPDTPDPGSTGSASGGAASAGGASTALGDDADPRPPRQDEPPPPNQPPDVMP